MAVTARFTNERRVPFGPPDARIRVAEAADLDGDGFLDIVVIDEARGVAIYHGRKDGGFAQRVATRQRQGHAVRADGR